VRVQPARADVGALPECGERMVLAVRQAEPYLRAWLALAAAICPCGGIGLLFLSMVAVSDINTAEAWEMLLLGGFIAAAFMMPLVFILRRRFLRLARRTQIVIAACAWAYGAALYLWFISQMN
jgi:hypothetical protein